MKRALKVVLWTAGIYVGLMLASGLAIKAMLSGSRIQQLFGTVKEKIPVTISAKQGTFDLVEWFRFRPVVRLSDLSVANPPGFSSQPMISAGQAEAQVALLSLLDKNLEIIRVSLVQPMVDIETNSRGDTNLSLLLTGMSSSSSKSGGERTADSPSGAAKSGGIAIRSLTITSGTIRYSGQTPASGFAIHDIGLSLADFAPDSTCRIKLDAAFFGGKKSRLDFEGRLGPFGADSVPAQGNLTVTFAPAEIPDDFRKTYFGDVLSDPGAGSRVSLSASMQGDLAQKLSGRGKLEITGFELGRSREKRLALEGQAPLNIVAHKLIGSPSFELATRDASLGLGQGRWTGSIEARLDGSRIQGQSNGSIKGVRIEELVDTFTTTRNTVSGQAEIPEYHLQFAGQDAAQIEKSLTGSGQIKLQQGRVALFDLLGAIESKIKNVLGGESTAQGATDFVTFNTHFEIKNGQILFPDLALENASSAITGQGRVGFDHSLEFDLTTSIAGALAAKLGGRPDASGQSRLRVPVKVRGTVESAKVYPDVASMAKTQAIEKATGLIDSFIRKRTAQPAK